MNIYLVISFLKLSNLSFAFLSSLIQRTEKPAEISFLKLSNFSFPFLSSLIQRTEKPAESSKLSLKNTP